MRPEPREEEPANSLNSILLEGNLASGPRAEDPALGQLATREFAVASDRFYKQNDEP